MFQQFFSRPHVKLTQHAKCHDDGGFNPAMIWIKHLTTTGFELCFAEWNQFSAYHQDNEIVSSAKNIMLTYYVTIIVFGNQGYS